MNSSIVFDLVQDWSVFYFDFETRTYYLDLYPFEDVNSIVDCIFVVDIKDYPCIAQMESYLQDKVSYLHSFFVKISDEQIKENSFCQNQKLKTYDFVPNSLAEFHFVNILLLVGYFLYLLSFIWSNMCSCNFGLVWDCNFRHFATENV